MAGRVSRPSTRAAQPAPPRAAARSEQYPTQDPKIISVFEILAAYETDCVFNHVYHSAKVRATGNVSLTDEYVKCIQGYQTGVKNDEHCYGEVVRGLHTFFINTTRFTTLSFADFVNKVVGMCVPEDFFRQFSTADKDEILSSILCDLISNLTTRVTQPDMLRRIIDEHDRSPDVTVRMLQDTCVTILITKRAALHNKFMKKVGQARELVSVDVFDDMKKALRRLVKEKTEAVAAAAEAADQAERYREKLREARSQESKLRRLVALLRSGRDEGPAAAGAALRVPRRCRRAEPDPLKPGRRVPRRSRIAEGSGSEDSESSDEGDEGDEGDESSSASSEPAPAKRRGEPSKRHSEPAPLKRHSEPAPAPRTAAAPRASAAPAPRAAAVPPKPQVAANFFKTVSVTPKPAAPAPAAPAPASSETGARPAMLTALLDDPDELDISEFIS